MFGLTKPGALCDEWSRKESNQELELSTTGDCHKGWYENRGHATDAEGLANLRQLCAYLLYHVTFKHSWVNDLQYQMGGEIEFATLGVSNDLTSMDVHEGTVVPPPEALEHPFITYILSYTEYGYILRNEDDDVNPELIKAIMARREDFESLKYNVRAIRSCINT